MTTTDHWETSAVGAYEVLAPHYDCYSSGNNYVAWAELLLQLARERGWAGSTVLDVGAGTGAIADVLAGLGLAVTGVDVSPAMIAQARATRHNGARFAVGDARTLNLPDRFDLVVCTDDVLNYLLTAAEVATSLAVMRRHLKPGALLMFDVNTLTVYRTSFAECRVVANRDCVLVRHGRGHGDFRPGEVCSVDLTIVESGALGCRPTPVRHSTHAQRHHPISEIAQQVTDAGLDLLALLSPDHQAGTLVEYVDEAQSNKVIVVAIRRE